MTDKKRKQGLFGPIYTKFENKPVEAIKHLIFVLTSFSMIKK